MPDAFVLTTNYLEKSGSASTGMVANIFFNASKVFMESMDHEKLPCFNMFVKGLAMKP